MARLGSKPNANLVRSLLEVVNRGVGIPIYRGIVRLLSPSYDVLSVGDTMTITPSTADDYYFGEDYFNFAFFGD